MSFRASLFTASINRVAYVKAGSNWPESSASMKTAPVMLKT